MERAPLEIHSRDGRERLGAIPRERKTKTEKRELSGLASRCPKHLLRGIPGIQKGGEIKISVGVQRIVLISPNNQT